MLQFTMSTNRNKVDKLKSNMNSTTFLLKQNCEQRKMVSQLPPLLCSTTAKRPSVVRWKKFETVHSASNERFSFATYVRKNWAQLMVVCLFLSALLQTGTHLG